jgi:hypothetical protein
VSATTALPMPVNDSGSRKERTRQQLDPAGSIGVRWATALFAVGALAYGCVMTYVARSQISSPMVAAIALALLAVACLVIIVGSSPYRAPLRGHVHFAAHILALGAYIAEVLSLWEANTRVRDDWGPICLGLLLVALSPYRPAREIVTSGVISAIFIGFVTLLQMPYFAHQGPSMVFVTLAITPMLALCFSAAVFSATALDALLRWQERARSASRTLVAQAQSVVARSVERDRVGILSQEVLPFFSDLLSREEITESDRARAAEIAASVRFLMVRDVDRTWLESLSAPSVLVDDIDRAAAEMTTEQRTAFRALLGALSEASIATEPSVHVVLARDTILCHGTITALLKPGATAGRSAFVSYFAEIRAAFDELHVEHDVTTLRLRFSYEQH